MSDSEESLSEPFQDSGSEYEPTLTKNNKLKIFNTNEGSSVDTDESSSDSNTSIRRKGSGNKKRHIDKSQNEIPRTSSARNLDSPSKSDGTSVELDGRDKIPDDDDIQRTESTKTRKRKANQKNWKKNIRKRLRQSGKEYKSCRGQTVRARAFRRNCVNCRFKCLDNFSEEEAAQIHNEFWTNNDDAKGHFYEKTTERYRVERQRNRNVRQKTKSYSYKYFFNKNEQKIRVCKKFYLGVLDISQIRIAYFYSKKRTGITSTPSQYQRGNRTENRIGEEHRQLIRDHINMFPRIPSHYCRSTSSKEYLERTLSLSKMYELYVMWCEEKNVTPQKKWLYYHIFNFEFNLGFHVPKKDLCNVCTEYNTKKDEQTLNEDLNKKYNEHIKAKLEAREEKKQDIEACKNDPSTALLCFDMQSVLTCPQTQVSISYYKKKYAVYNFTGNDVVKKTGYCILWHELLGGRKGVDIASALYVLLEKLLSERPNVTKLILWSDACVPQNKNSHMSAALLYFLNEHPEIESIIQKFQVPGHSCVQEVDAMHSTLDRNLNKLELHSPLAIYKAIKNVRARKPYHTVQMNKNKFLDFKPILKSVNLTTVPYKTLVQISYNHNSSCVKYKLHFSDESPIMVEFLKRTRQTNQQVLFENFPRPTVQPPPPNLAADKIEHIRSLSNHFSAVDLQFRRCIINNF